MRHNSKFQMLDNSLSYFFLQICQNLPREHEKVSLPELVLHLNHKIGADQFGGARTGGDFLSDSRGPGRTSELLRRERTLGGIDFPEKSASAFHGGRTLQV